MDVIKLLQEKLEFFDDIVNEATQNEDATVPLVLAAQKNDMDMVKFLYDHGAAPMISNDHGQSIYHIAAMANNVRMLDFAIKQDLFNID